MKVLHVCRVVLAVLAAVLVFPWGFIAGPFGILLAPALSAMAYLLVMGRLMRVPTKR